MPSIDASGAECFVFTYKEGLLSPIAHDLKIRVERFSLTVEGEGDTRSLEATFDASSLVVVCARQGERDAHGALTPAQRAEIEGNIQKDVLHTRRHPEVRFTSTQIRPVGEGYHIEGRLELHGSTRPVRVSARRDGDRFVAEVPIHQPDFGIKPYRAALGALRVAATLRVRISIPASTAT